MDYLILWGGEDISPNIYGHKKLSYSLTNPDRDQNEIKKIDQAVQNNIPIIGVCRGAQLLCAYTGGALYQHISPRQNGTISIECFDGSVYKTVVDHHQVMIPNMAKATILAIQHLKKPVTAYMTETQTTTLENIPEIIYYKDINALAIQPHPEWLGQGQGFKLWLQSILKNLLGVHDDIFDTAVF